MAKAKLQRIPASEERQPNRAALFTEMLFRSVHTLSTWRGDVKMGMIWRIGSRLNANCKKHIRGVSLNWTTAYPSSKAESPDRNAIRQLNNFVEGHLL